MGMGVASAKIACYNENVAHSRVFVLPLVAEEGSTMIIVVLIAQDCSCVSCVNKLLV
jgi:hypothetical protein